MIYKIAVIPFFGLPLVVYSGFLAFVLLLSTATVGFLNYRGITAIPFRYHPWLALSTIIVVILHALLGLSINFGF